MCPTPIHRLTRSTAQTPRTPPLTPSKRKKRRASPGGAPRTPRRGGSRSRRGAGGLSALAAATLALLAAPAQSPAAPKRIGLLRVGSSRTVGLVLDTLVQKLEEAGYRRGRELEIFAQASPQNPDEIRRVARALSANRLDLLVTTNTLGLIGAFRATKRVPILFLLASNPLGIGGLAKSLEEPGGRVTGVRVQTPWGKYLEYAETFLPGLQRIGVLVDGRHPGFLWQARVIAERARKRNLAVRREAFDTLKEVPEKFESLASRAGLVVLLSVRGIRAIRRVCARSAVPVSSTLGPYKNCSLFTYSLDYRSLGNQAGKLAVDILRGVSPAIIPIESPIRYSLTINRRVAKRLSIPLGRNVLRLGRRAIE
ncbi:MAG: ABC transporter substrate-binding protein [Nitrospinota bacterium]